MAIYDVFVRAAIEDKASAVLAAISQRVFALDQGMAKLTRSFEQGGTAAKVLTGALLGAGGFGLLYAMKEVAKAGEELSHRFALIHNQGLNPQQFERAKQAIMGINTQVQGITRAQAGDILGRVYSTAGAEEVTKALPLLSKFAVVFGNITGDPAKGIESLYDLVRAAHQLGRLSDPITKQFDEKRFEGFLDLMTKIANLTHGMVGPGQILPMAKMLAGAGTNLTDQGLMAMALATQDMGGFRAGTAFASLSQQLLSGHIQDAYAQELARIGLIPGATSAMAPGGHLGAGGQVEGRRGIRRAFGYRGGMRPGHAGGMIFSEEAIQSSEFINKLTTNPLEAAAILNNALVAAGYTTLKEQTKEIYRLFPRQTETRLIGDFIKNYSQLVSESQRGFGALGVGASYDYILNNDLRQNMTNLSTAWTNLMAAIGLPTTRIAIDVLKHMTSAIKSLDAVAVAHPGAIEGLFRAITAVATGLLGLGIGRLATLAGIPFGPIGMAIAGILGTLAGMAVINWDSMKSGLESVKNAILHLWEALKGIVQFYSPFNKTLFQGGDMMMREGQSIIPISSTRFADELGRGIVKAMYMEGRSGGAGRSYDVSYGGGANDNRVWSSPLPESGAGIPHPHSNIIPPGVIPHPHSNIIPPHPHSDVPLHILPNITGGAMPSGRVPRGIRFNNPGDISLPMAGWHGGGTIVGAPGQPGFAYFPSMQIGMEAFRHRLSTYMARGMLTISALNRKYAESSLWKFGVSKASGIGINTPLDPHNEAQMEALAHGILSQELGSKWANYAEGKLVHPNHGRVGTVLPHSSAGVRQLQLHTDLNIDGRKVAQAVTGHYLRDNAHSKQAAYFNGLRHYAGPDRQVNTA